MFGTRPYRGTAVRDPAKPQSPRASYVPVSTLFLCDVNAFTSIKTVRSGQRGPTAFLMGTAVIQPAGAAAAPNKVQKVRCAFNSLFVCRSLPCTVSTMTPFRTVDDPRSATTAGAAGCMVCDVALVYTMVAPMPCLTPFSDQHAT